MRPEWFKSADGASARERARLYLVPPGILRPQASTSTSTQGAADAVMKCVHAFGHALQHPRAGRAMHTAAVPVLVQALADASGSASLIAYYRRWEVRTI